MLNRIKRKIILKLIFEKINNKKKLKLLKCNKRLLDKLDISINDYKDSFALKELNNKFNLNLDDTNVEFLDI